MRYRWRRGCGGGGAVTSEKTSSAMIGTEVGIKIFKVASQVQKI